MAEKRGLIPLDNPVVKRLTGRKDSRLFIYFTKGTKVETKIKEGEYVLVRSNLAGVFVGTLAKLDGLRCTLQGARRLWFWSGASSLSELAEHGVSRPSECKFPCEVAEVILEACEVLLVSDKARHIIAEVPEWKQR